MSLFDVLKYPVSIPPTEEELKAIPDAILCKFVADPEVNWVTRVMLGYTQEYRKARIIKEYTDPYACSDSERRHEVTILRKVIREYDESI